MKSYCEDNFLPKKANKGPSFRVVGLSNNPKEPLVKEIHLTFLFLFSFICSGETIYAEVALFSLSFKFLHQDLFVKSSNEFQYLKFLLKLIYSIQFLTFRLTLLKNFSNFFRGLVWPSMLMVVFTSNG